MLKESLEQFIAPVYGKTKRTSETYKTVADHCSQAIDNLAQQYLGVENNQQKLREIRNDIDYYLRRYHRYCIEERNGMSAHYHEIGADSDTDFEHLIPASRIRDLMLSGVLTVEQALNAPTVKLSRSKHVALKDAGWASHTPDMWLPFVRYDCVFLAKFETYDGKEIDTKTWTLQQHYDYFAHLRIQHD
jgi:hypothetical protein